MLKESSISHHFSYLSCDICGSSDILETPEGYVCLDCGIVLEIQKLQYNRPYNEDLIQYAKGIGSTKIGTKRERTCSLNYYKIGRLSKLNTMINSANTWKNKREEIHAVVGRIFGDLHLTDHKSVKEMVIETSFRVWNKLPSGSKYRNIEKLASFITYACLKLRNIPVNKEEIVECSVLSKKEFNHFLLQLRNFIPRYETRNKQKYIVQRISEITEHFNLGIEYYYLSKKILFRLWKEIKNSTDNVIAGLVCSISLLSLKKRDIRVSAICNHLGIRMSTIQSQVKQKIFKRFKVEGFQSLIKSSDLLREILKKLKLIDSKEEIRKKSIDRVDIIFKDLDPIFTDHSNVGYYFFATKNTYTNLPNIISITRYGFPLDEKSLKMTEVSKKPIIDLEILKYLTVKGPPALSMLEGPS